MQMAQNSRTKLPLVTVHTPASALDIGYRVDLDSRNAEGIVLHVRWRLPMPESPIG